MIYFDNAATSFLKPDCVKEAVYESFSYVANASRGTHELSLSTERMITETRLLLAELFDADPHQVAFTMNATESLNIAIKGLLETKDHVITTVMEHNSVLRPLYEVGCELSFLPLKADHSLDLDRLNSLKRANTRAVVMTHVANLTGAKNDIERVAAFCKANDLLFIVDASQSGGTEDLKLRAMGIDVICLTGHKGLLGPQGTGAILVRKGLSIQLLKSGGSGIETFNHQHPLSMPVHLEAGTLNGQGLAGLRAGLLYIKEQGMEALRAKERLLLEAFTNGIKDHEGYECFAVGIDKGAILALRPKIGDAKELSVKLSERGIVVRSGGHCAPLHHEALGTVDSSLVRFSFSPFNTLSEVSEALRALEQIHKESL